MSESPWRKSSYGGGANSNRVEVATASAVLVRDTTDQAGPTLSLTRGAWTAFLAALR